MQLQQLSRADLKKLLGKSNGEGVNVNRIMLSFMDFDYDPNLITQQLDLQPTGTGVAGQHLPGVEGAPEQVQDFTFWKYEWYVHANDFIGDLLDAFMRDVVLPRLDELQAISVNAETTLSITQYYHDGNNPNFHFTRQTLKVLQSINAAIDMDIYCLAE
ncbi:protein of unknown function [Chitinophaga costaii]|uniref:DUF4279 domain-containing protein n=1 Tax=Chitinophaga costaii TaxID=1335309 RepID=A0A1C4BP26_9BACT|nr:DUF4279 domain-containing protein [Chitinophaga costaii]PUZ27534.1 DUF4279 domain-containing protein [Chitinophaga costaii]SCC08452.1 protein of unknown function [Chitinophaga costaii]